MKNSFCIHLREARDFLSDLRFMTLLDKDFDIWRSQQHPYAESYPKRARLLRRYHKVEHKISVFFDPLRDFIEDALDKHFNGPIVQKIHSLQRRNFNEFDVRLLHASFQVLVDFVETDLPFDSEWFDDNNIRPKKGRRYPEAGRQTLIDNRSRSEYEELLFLYDWWVNDRSKINYNGHYISVELAGKVMPDDDAESAFHMLDETHWDFMNKLDHDMLVLLAKARSAMWT